jgi:hypothetical protein
MRLRRCPNFRYNSRVWAENSKDNRKCLADAVLDPELSPKMGHLGIWSTRWMSARRADAIDDVDVTIADELFPPR